VFVGIVLHCRSNSGLDAQRREGQHLPASSVTGL
jgi:hypothetical protein